jgi:hypothetical protein
VVAGGHFVFPLAGEFFLVRGDALAQRFEFLHDRAVPFRQRQRGLDRIPCQAIQF